MESFFQIGEVTLEGLVSPGEFLCFSHLVTLVRKALYTEVWTKQQLEQFEYEIREYRSEFINLYGCVEETVRGESMLIISSLLGETLLIHHILRKKAQSEVCQLGNAKASGGDDISPW